MKSAIEIRREAWRLLWEERWLQKIFAGSLVFGCASFAANCIVHGVVFPEAQENIRQLLEMGLEEALERLRDPVLLRSLYMMVALSTFLSFVFGGIASFGLARLQLKAARGHAGAGWFKGTLEGFRDPLGLAWLSFRLWLRVWWPAVFGAVPLCILAFASGRPVALAPALACFAASIVNHYRYSQTWFLKAANPGWGASQCLAESAKLTDGSKMRCFRLDCAYWRPATLYLLCMASALTSSFAGADKLASLAMTALFSMAIFMSISNPVGRAILHCELLSGRSASAGTSAAAPDRGE